MQGALKISQLQYMVLPDWLSDSPVAVTVIGGWVPISAAKEGIHCSQLNTLLPLCRSCYSVLDLYQAEIKHSFETNKCLIQMLPKWFTCSDLLQFIYA